MIITAWRLVTWPHRNDAFTGEGCYKYGNRWNSPGRRIVYLGESQALAALENIVHFEPGKTPPAYAFVSVEFDAKLVQTLAVSLPPNWGTMTAVTNTIGNEWYDAGVSCIFAVPTALVPRGTNYLFNVTHPDFAKVKVGAPIPYAFDQRLNDLAKPSPNKPSA